MSYENMKYEIYMHIKWKDNIKSMQRAPSNTSNLQKEVKKWKNIQVLLNEYLNGILEFV